MCNKDNSVAASPCLLRSLLLAQRAMAVHFSLALVACHCLALQLLLYVLVTAGFRQISSNTLADLAALNPCALCMLSGVLLPVAVTIRGCTKVGLSMLLLNERLLRPKATLMRPSCSMWRWCCWRPTWPSRSPRSRSLCVNESSIHEIWGSQVVHPLATLLAR